MMSAMARPGLLNGIVPAHNSDAKYWIAATSPETNVAPPEDINYARAQCKRGKIPVDLLYEELMHDLRTMPPPGRHNATFMRVDPMIGADTQEAQEEKQRRAKGKEMSWQYYRNLHEFQGLVRPTPHEQTLYFETDLAIEAGAPAATQRLEGANPAQLQPPMATGTGAPTQATERPPTPDPQPTKPVARNPGTTIPLGAPTPRRTPLLYIVPCSC